MHGQSGRRTTGKAAIISAIIRRARRLNIAPSVGQNTRSLLSQSSGFHQNSDRETLACNTTVSRQSIKHMYNKQNLAKLKKMNELAPELMKAFWAFDKLAVAEGAIPVKYKELMAVAVA